ncbi:MAG: helix-turn-helix transcriptional regulator [Pseudonocardiaceae bacterium]
MAEHREIMPAMDGTENTPLNQTREWTPRPVGVVLLERGEELAHIDKAIAALGRGHGRLLVIQGAGGIGKSALLRAVCEHAAGQELPTLTARANELERDFGFGVVRQLLETRLVRAGESERAELLVGAAGLAGPVLGLGGSVGDSFAALHGLYWLVANLTVSRPVVLACDDLHWADDSSLRWLVYLCNRLEGLPLLVAVTTRPPRPGHPQLLRELLAVADAQFLHPGALSEAAVSRLVGRGLGAQPDPAFVCACTTATGGNPFAVRELVFDLAANGVAPVAVEAAGVTERVPGQVERVVLARLGRLHETAVQLARALAVMGEGIDLRLAAAFADLNIEAAAEAADALLAADLLDECRPLHFLHPLVRSAIYEQLAPGARSQAHARAARLLTAESAGSEKIAMQLLSCEPMGDAGAVQTLRAAAVVALERGAPETAITYLRRALAEPPEESARAAVLGELGCAEKIARDPAAVVHLEQAWQATTEPLARAQLAAELADAHFYTASLGRCSAVLQAGLADLGDRDPVLAMRLQSDKAAMESCSAHPPTLEWLRELITRGGPTSRAVRLTLAYVLAARGERCHEVVGLVERGLDEGRFLAEETSEALPAMYAVYALIRTDALDHAHALTEAMLADAQTRGSVLGIQAAIAHRGWVALRRGALAEAEADTRAGFELATDHGLTFTAPFHAAYLGLTLLERGELEQAAAVVEGVALAPALTQMPLSAAVLLEARGRVRLARGQRPQAIADLRRCGQLVTSVQVHNPNVVAWRSALARALPGEQSNEAWKLAQSELALARRAGTARAIGIALRACGLLANIKDGKEGIEILEESVAVLEPSPMRLELAHSLTELGAALRRAGARVTARRPLHRAMDLAARCGAIPLAERARDEALAAGARPRRPWTSGVHALTPSELRVARLAAQNLSNRDIAQTLFITTKTVSDHLSSAYRKLNIHNRTELSVTMTPANHTPP